MLALTSATGKIGGAVISALLDNNLVEAKDIVICTSSDLTGPRFSTFHERKITVRHADFDSPESLERGFRGCSSLFLVSTPRIEMDFDNAPLWSGREKHHRAAIDAAIAVGVEHIYYTSLAFGNPSKASVMRAHIRTEKYLKELEEEGKVKVTIIREGLYNESWPLYFGYYFGLKNETRKEVVVAGDGPISWTSIPDLGYATARVLVAPSAKWAGKTCYLSQKKTQTLHDIAEIVSRIRKEKIELKVVSKKEYEDYYVRKMGREKASVEWWSSTYEALEDGECKIEDPTLELFLLEAGRVPKPLEATIEEMLA